MIFAMSPDSGFTSPNQDAIESGENLAYLNLLSPPGTSKLIFPLNAGYFVQKSRRRLHFSDSEVRRPASYKISTGTQTGRSYLSKNAHATRRDKRRQVVCRQVAEGLKEMADDFEQYLLQQSTPTQSFWMGVCTFLFGPCFRALLTNA